MTFSMVALHKRQDLLDGCVELLNSEWSRSQAARLHSLEKSCDGLPYSLVMIETTISQEEAVAGYCRLAKVVNQPKAVFIESVVVPNTRRGQGLGRRLMELAEDHSRQHGYTQIYLTTKDKQKFYEHLGYQYCEPVNTLNAQVLETCSCQLVTNTIVNNEPSSKNSTPTTSCTKQKDAEQDGYTTQEETKHDSIINVNNSNQIITSNQETCYKQAKPGSTNFKSDPANSSQESCQPLQEDIPAGIPLTPPPPPPPLPPVPVPSVRIYWMMKNLYEGQ